MTTELEQQFFKVFGINKRCCHDNYKHQKEVCHRIPEQCQDYQYPEITAENLLKLICILTVARKHFELPKIYTIQEMKDYILQICVFEQEGIYTRVRSLFDEER